MPFRASHSFGRALTPGTPSISGTVASGSAITITPGAGPTAVRYDVYRDGIRVGTTNTTTFTCRPSTIGEAITVKAIGPGGGTSLSSNALGWNPSALLERFEINSLTPGSISSFVGAKAGINLLQATSTKQPTASQTSFNGHPGLSFDGGDSLKSAATALFSTLQSVRIVFAPASWTNAFGFAIQLGDNYTTPNSFTVGVDFTGADQLVIGSNGNGTSARSRTFNQVPFLSDGVTMEVCCDTSNTAFGASLARQDGVTSSFNAIGSTTAPGNFATDTLSLGADGAGSFPFAGGVFGGAVLFLSGNLDNIDLKDAASYVRNKTGRSSSATGRLMCCGDSITLGLKSGGGSAGGWRTTANAWLNDVVFVGPYDDNGKHRGVSGEKAQTIAGATAALLSEIAVSTPDSLVLGWAVNDLATASARTATQLFADYDTIITAIRASYPTMKIMILQCEAPTDGLHNLSEIASFNSQLPAFASARSCSSGPAITPTFFDGLHPDVLGYGYLGRLYGPAIAVMLLQ